MVEGTSARRTMVTSTMRAAAVPTPMSLVLAVAYRVSNGHSYAMLRSVPKTEISPHDVGRANCGDGRSPSSRPVSIILPEESVVSVSVGIGVGGGGVRRLIDGRVAIGCHGHASPTRWFSSTGDLVDGGAVNRLIGDE